MDFSTKYTVRTDLADEVLENLGEKKGKIGDGIFFETKNICGTKIDFVTVENENAVRTTGKPMGKYATVGVGEIWKSSKETFESIAKAIGCVVKGMLPKEGACLVAALGNERIAADALGPFAARNVIVTRHIKELDRRLFDSFGGSECACIVPGVMGDTGAEAFEIIKGVTDAIKPSSVIVVDALASKNISRLAKTVQISDSGISPGSGVGNARHEISRKTLGVPTIAVGVPTVVEAYTLCLDILKSTLKNEQDIYNYIEEKMPDGTGSFFVCPKETDRIIKCMAKLVGYSLNFAFHEGMTISEMDEFLS